ncbi:hypothetical protein OS493_040597, partial [Desmophyllum pertusum]
SFGMSTLKQCASPAWNFHQTAPWLRVAGWEGSCDIRTERYNCMCYDKSKCDLAIFTLRLTGNSLSDGYPFSGEFPVLA